MSLKTQLCRAVIDAKENSSSTYDDIHSATGVHKTQIASILRSEGEGVSVDNIEKVLSFFDVTFYLVVEEDYGSDEEHF